MAEKKPGKGAKPGKGEKAAPAEGVETAAVEKGPKPPTPRLLARYRDNVVPELRKRFNYSSPMQVPKLVSITLNVGLGEAIQNAKLLEAAANELGAITGQKAVITKSRKAIANFRLRENQSIGCMVTLRRNRMYEFLDRLMNVSLPRVRDFRGVSRKSFDGRGNYTMGVREQFIFPEVDYDKVERVHGLNVSIVTTARNDEEGAALLTELGMPFRD
jgi:large subunit ribosomal protein L5